VSLGFHTGDLQVVVGEPGEVRRVTLSHEVRTAGVDGGQGSQEAAYHVETLCRWTLVGLAVGSRSSEAVGDRGGRRRWEMVEAGIHRSSHGAVGREDPGSRLVDGGKWVGMRGSDAVVVVDGA
jgi:hypothetical protein